jgi:hypothetical protein
LGLVLYGKVYTDRFTGCYFILLLDMKYHSTIGIGSDSFDPLGGYPIEDPLPLIGIDTLPNDSER